MACTQLNLQRNSEIYFSTVDLAGGAAITAMTPQNTWRIEVLSGFALSQSAANQDITSLESGTDPDRSVQRFNTAINPTEWNFQAYVRPTGIEDLVDDSTTGNSKPVADWFLWQSLLSNAAPASGVVERSAWQAGGKFASAKTGTAGSERATSVANVAEHSPNFATATENHLYFKLDNVYYQIKKATVNSAEVDAAIDGIATTSWSGFGTNLIELAPGAAARNRAVSVFGGILDAGTSVVSNSNHVALSATASFHPWGTYNVAGVVTTAEFIKNRLSTIEIKHAPSATGTGVTYTFAVTALNFSVTNNLTYLTPEELAALNVPIGQFAGSRTVTGSLSAYLRSSDGQSAQFLRNIVNDTRTSAALTSNANLVIGGATAPFFAAVMPRVQFDFPVHAIEDVIGLSVDFLAQQSGGCAGDEITLLARRA